MAVPMLTFFNCNGGVGTTTFIFHLAWMLSNIGERVLVCDLDPQASLTSAFFLEDELESLWSDAGGNRTIYQCVAPVTASGELKKPEVYPISEFLGIIPGDLGLANFEERLWNAWPSALGDANLQRPFLILSALWHVMQMGASSIEANIILVDIGPNLDALNRSAIISSNHVVPL